MRPRTSTRLYQTASRLWLTAAALSLMLPEGARLGVWLPLHLALAGAVSVAISGAMQTFAVTLTAAPEPPAALVWAQFGLVNAGTALIAIGRPTTQAWIVATGGTCFVAGAFLLGLLVWRARRRSLNRRHSLPIRMYLLAVGCVMAGGTFGAVMGSGAIHGADAYLGLRHAHLTLNVLGWASGTITATLVTLLPTTLRVRMPPWHGAWTAGLIVAGVITLATGLALRTDPVALAGAISYTLGAGGIAWMVVRMLRTPRRWPVPIMAKHFLLALAWFLVGTIAMTVAIARDGVAGFDAFRGTFLVVFVGGWIVQTLLGAWLYLLPMATPAHPDERRGYLIGVELAGPLQLAALNVGVALIAMRTAGWVPAGAGAVGVGLALAGGAIALGKAWWFVPLSRVPATDRARDIWTP